LFIIKLTKVLIHLICYCDQGSQNRDFTHNRKGEVKLYNRYINRKIIQNS
jgi:hypothetical protein